MAEEPGRGGRVLRLLFWGTPIFALPSLLALSEEGHVIAGVVTQPDRPSGRGRKLSASPVKQAAEKEGIRVLTPHRPRSTEFLETIRAMDPQLSVVVAYGHILDREVLDVPEKGSVNLHASLLPELRGAAPIHWAILRGHTVTGVSVMRMVEEMDAGPVLLQTEERIGPEETAAELSTRLSQVGAQALVEALALLEEGAAEEVEQDHSRATFAPKLDREKARVDWTRPAVELGCHLRGLDASPGAWTILEGEPVKLFRPRPEPRYVHGASPGTILEGSPETGLLVACGSGALAIHEIHPPGKRRMPVGAWLQGRPIGGGTRFE
jgi:methionyl-tRNA formyltransferase